MQYASLGGWTPLHTYIQTDRRRGNARRSEPVLADQCRDCEYLVTRIPSVKGAISIEALPIQPSIICNIITIIIIIVVITITTILVAEIIIVVVFNIITIIVITLRNLANFVVRQSDIHC